MWKSEKALTSTLILIIVGSLFVGGLIGYSINYLTNSNRIKNLESQVADLQQQISNIQSQQKTQCENITNIKNVTYILWENISLSTLYEKVKDSVVIIRGFRITHGLWGTYYTQVQGSGFIYNYNGQMIIVTNCHVIYNAVNITVTFINGDGYSARVLGYDQYADLAVLSADAPESEFKPLEITNSSTLKVGEPVIAVGNPYGLAGSMSVGIVSALGRTITETQTGGYPIADVIQTTVPLNPGNSGGPLLNVKGQVVGITTAIVSNSQGLGFAIPSNTILREIGALIENGTYNKHPWLGASGIDMTYEIAKAMNTNITYGWLIVQVVNGGPADKAGLRGGTKQAFIAGEQIVIGGDIIIAINNTKIRNLDDLSTYLEEHTSPGQKINVTIVRNSQIMNVTVTLEARPAPNTS